MAAVSPTARSAAEALKPARWLVPQLDQAGIDGLASALRLHSPTARVLWRRGYQTPEAGRRFLAPSLDHLHDPFLLRGMPEAAERLYQAIDCREQILLYGDYDVDGTSAIVVLTKALQFAGALVRYHVPHRLRDGYGMHANVIEQAAADGVRLIVSVDTGIRAGEVVGLARRLGVDVIVTDHHLPEEELPPALAVINPNRPDCPYPEKNLCGAGVAFKLVQALLMRLQWPEEKVKRLMESFLKLVALATVADVVPLTGENRIIVRRGLEGFQQIRNPGLRALMRVAGFKEGDTPSASQVAFRLAPRLNAAGRMAHAGEVLELFLTNDSARAEAIADQLQQLNQDRRQTESDIVKAILQECSRVPVTDEQAALVFSGANWHRGVVGIVASRLVERYNRPVFVLSEEGDMAQGSGRSIPVFHLLSALESMPRLFTKFGGHKQAAGLTMRAGDVQEFRERLTAYAAARLTPDDFRPMLEIDAPLRIPELTHAAAEEILSLSPFGCGNPPPLFVITGAELCGEPVVFAEKHLRLRVQQEGRPLTLKAWNMAERAAEWKPGMCVDIAVTVEEDAYSASRGYAGWCVTAKDIRPAASAA